MGAVKRAAGKKSKKAAGKANALAMGGVGIFAPKVLSPALATICGGKKMARTEVTKKIWAYIKKNSLNQGRTIKPDSTRRPSSRWRASTCSRWPATSASTCREPLGEPRRFSRRVPTSRRALESRPHEFDSCLLTSATHPDFSSCPLVPLHALWSGGEAGQERRSHDGDSSGSLQDLDFPKFQTF